MYIRICMFCYILSVYIHTYRRCICVCYTCTHTHIHIYIYKYMKSNHIYRSTSYTSLYIYIYIYAYRHVFPWIPSAHLSRNAPSRHSLRPLRHYWWWLARQAPFSQFFPGETMETMETPWKNGPFIWVNYNMSLTWNVGLFWDSLPQ